VLTAQDFLTHQITSVILILMNAFYDLPSIHQAEKGQIFFSLLNGNFKDVERFGWVFFFFCFCFFLKSGYCGLIKVQKKIQLVCISQYKLIPPSPFC